MSRLANWRCVAVGRARPDSVSARSLPLRERRTEVDLRLWEDDVTVAIEAEARVMGHLPGMTVEVEERPRVAAVEGLRRLASNLRSDRTGPLDDLVHPLAGADVVREGDAAPTRTVIRDTGVLGEFVASPQHKDAGVGLEEGGLLNIERG